MAVNAVILETKKTHPDIKITSAIDFHKKLFPEVKPNNTWYDRSSQNTPQKALDDVINSER